ncbi:ADP-ribose pyrophosphatase YjhB (NUDIX family) [Bacillus thuringiensis]|uniref:ADP-ribose pyrophosphatase YjhB (NUDIX family) n=2 Tax=Bacillaceae TaxID=186817 RepID=A0A4R4BGD6_BACTU|nr:ADP-ribose pyrophosphatase YjhB (NUDIX family) [Bacillus thuringiensis]TCW55629.1 ADP-ribose pyrophosphatase YjhB (NUDIX family) [Bacillus thuringiensis]
MMANYIKELREKVGHDCVLINFAGGCVLNEYGEVLLQKRGDFNAWGFPGGAMEIGESAAETAIREIKEETGYDVEINELIGVYTKYFQAYPNGDRAQSILIFFSFSITGGEKKIDGDETLDLKFFPLNKMPPLFNQQHEDCLQDLLEKRVGVYR